MITEIPQFLYTRVNADRSPKNKEGFQFLASSPGFLDKKTQMEVECRLHYPGTGIFHHKTAGCTLRSAGGWNLILLYYTDLPEIRDAAGRTGIFLVHGFCIPLLDDHSGLLCDDIAPLLEPLVCRDYEKALAMGADGTLPALEIRFSPNDDPVRVPDRDAWVWLQAGLMAPANGQALAWKYEGAGSPLNLPGMLPALPLALIEKVSWDDAFDNGKLHFTPIRLAGWKQHVPTTGQPLLIGPDGRETDPLPPWWEPLRSHPYMNWLLNSPWKPANRTEMEHFFAAGRFLAGDSDVLPDSMAVPDTFYSLNETAVRNRFRQFAARVLPAPVANLLATTDEPEALALLIRKNFPSDRLAQALEKHVRLTPTEFSPETIRQLPAPVKAASPLLELLSHDPESWKIEQLLAVDDLAVADWAFAHGKISHAVATLGMVHAEWYSILPDAEKLITDFLLESVIPPHLQALGSRFQRWLFRTAPRSKDSTIGQAWLKRVNQYFTYAPADAAHDLTAFLTANRDTPLLGLPDTIRRGVAGPTEVPAELQRSTVEWYRRHLGMTEEQLRASGWPEESLKTEGILGKFKRWFT